ncbi:MAG: HAD hydrolase-like protein, partial [Thermoleophilia bacterium]|nr:HAD hydrolase-like protein [Thermoleophilia bacterium]
MGRLSELDAVTLDAYGTLLELDDPVRRLRDALRERGVERSSADVERAFRAENAHYAKHRLEARDGPALERLRAECARVFADALSSDIDFTAAFVAALRFHPLPGVLEGLALLRAHGVALAVVSNWDISLPDHLAGAGVWVDTVVTGAEAGVAKPDARPLLIALERLGVAPNRALHVGDSGQDER